MAKMQYKCKKKKRSAQHMCITQNVHNTKYEGKNSEKNKLLLLGF